MCDNNSLLYTARIKNTKKYHVSKKINQNVLNASDKLINFVDITNSVDYIICYVRQLLKKNNAITVWSDVKQKYSRDLTSVLIESDIKVEITNFGG